jgi:hypothetical protein
MAWNVHVLTEIVAEMFMRDFKLGLLSKAWDRNLAENLLVDGRDTPRSDTPFSATSWVDCGENAEATPLKFSSQNDEILKLNIAEILRNLVYN